MTADMLAQQVSVEPSLCPVHRRAEAKNQLTPGIGLGPEFGFIPSGPAIAFRVVEQVVPAAWHGDEAGVVQPVPPPGSFSLVQFVELELPQARKIVRAASCTFVRIEEGRPGC